MTAITFDSSGTRCAGIHMAGVGDAFLGEDGLRPCVVLAHGFGGTVDSGLVPFAERFASAGLDALAFDYRHFGASEGEPRQLLSIGKQLEDYAAAIAYARSLPGVDPARIAVWGSSISGGHVVAVAVADGRVAAVISQVPAMDGAAAVLNILRYAGPAHLLLVAAGVRDQIAALRGEDPVMISLVGPRGSVAAMTTPDAQPGYEAIMGETSRNEVAARIMLRAGSYRPGRRADELPCPMLVQVADRDSVAPVKAAQDAVWLATGRGEMRTYPIGHFDIYTGEPFEKALADQLLFLRRHLTARTRQDIATPSANGAVGTARAAAAKISASAEAGVALVTGASRGLGKEVARQLGARGYEVLVSARDAEQAATVASELAGAAQGAGTFAPLTLDVASEQSIAAASEQVHSSPARLDVLVNNAGIGSDFGVSGTDPDFAAIQRALDTNFFGAYRVTIALLDLLRASAHPRIVNVSSGMGGVAEMGGWTPGYRVSKASMNAMTRILATELKDAGFLVNSACPGFVNTDMGGPMGATKSVEDGAAGIVWLATLPDDGPTGGFFRDGKPVTF